MAVTTGVQEQLSPNLVKSLFMYPFARWTTEEKLLVKNLGPDKPEINISQQIKVKDKCYKQSFCRSWFNRKTWLAGCGAANALFCFPSSSEVTNVKRFGQRLD